MRLIDEKYSIHGIGYKRVHFYCALLEKPLSCSFDEGI